MNLERRNGKTGKKEGGKKERRKGEKNEKLEIFFASFLACSKNHMQFKLTGNFKETLKIHIFTTRLKL